MVRCTGVKYPMQDYGTGITNVCPVCNGSKVVLVTRTYETQDVITTKDLQDADEAEAQKRKRWNLKH